MSIIQGTSKSSAAAAYEISQSVRFNDDDSASLTRTPSSAGDKRTWTFSVWTKRGNLGADRRIFTAASNGTEFFFDANDKLNFYHYSGGFVWRYISTAVFRDCASWYHFLLRVDTTDPTAANRIRVYANGQQINDWDTSTAPSLNAEGFVNGTSAHYIGRYSGSDNNHWDGYLAEINHVDGSSLAPTEFGETDADTGQWVPVKYTNAAGYGTNGFYITGADSADLGADQAGSNDFTSIGLTSADSVLDSPTDNFCTWNPTESSSKTYMSLQDGNLVANGFDSAQRGTIFVSSGKWYAELTISAAMSAYFGISEDTANMTGNPSLDNLDGYLYYSFNGQKIDQAGSGSAYGDTWRAAGKTVGVAVDMDNGAIWFSVDGVWQNSATISEIQNGTTTNAAFTGISGNFALVYSNFTAGLGTLNTGQSSFSYTQPTGFNAWSTANLPDPTIADPSAYFQTTLYTGNGVGSASGGQEINQSGNSTFQPDFVWNRVRNLGTETHCLQDVVRGANKRLQSNSSAAENTETEGLLSFDSDGFTVGSRDPYNKNTATYVAWMWAADGTSGSSNTDGTVSSTVSASGTSGFSVAKWTHTTASNYTVGHGLGAVPKMIIVKTTDQATNWGVYHSDITVGNRLLLNSTSAQIAGYWGANSWTSSTFSIGSARDTNGSTMIAYCFAEIPGFSRFSSFVGNGSSDGPMIYTGFRPAQIVIKEVTTADSWEMYDSARDPINVTGRTIRADSANAEFDGRSLYRSVDFLSNGFKIRTSNATINSSGATFIFWAFAESPFRYANAR